jgi:predicted DNA-binding transcriptional regulator AlpA
MMFAREQIDELAVMTRPQMAAALGISLDTLDRMHQSGEAPPRLRISPRRWGYPVHLYKQWRAGRLTAAK